MRIAFGTDERSAATDGWMEELVERGHEIVECGIGEPWVDVGHRVGVAVASGRAELGIVCCWTGTGVSIAANKVAGVRAALCTDASTATGARRWNDANVLALGLRLTTETVGREVIDAFLTAGPDEDTAEQIAGLEYPHH